MNLQTYVSSTDVTTILGAPTLFDEDFVVKEEVKLDLSPHPLNAGPVSKTKGVLNVHNVIKSEPAQSESEILQTHAPDCELHMQISNIISLRQDHSPTNTAEYSMDSTIIGGRVTLQAHLLNSSTYTDVDINQDSDESPGVSQEVTENLYKTNSTDFCDIDHIERGSQDVMDILHQTHSMDVTDISPTEKLSDSNSLQDVTSQDITEHSHETHFKDVTGTSPIESLADLNTLQDATPVPDRDSSQRMSPTTVFFSVGIMLNPG